SRSRVAMYGVGFGLFARHAATELASLLAVFTLALYAAERGLRGRARFHHREAGARTLPARPLSGGRAAAATGFVALVVGVAFVLPVVRLLTWIPREAAYDPRYPHFLTNTLLLAVLTAAVTLLAAVIIGYGQRVSRTAIVTGLARIAGMGYGVCATWLGHRDRRAGRPGRAGPAARAAVGGEPGPAGDRLGGRTGLCVRG